MGRPAIELTEDQIYEALTLSSASMPLAAEFLGVSTQTLRRRVANSLRLIELQFEQSALLGDWAFANLVERIKAGSAKDARFFLEMFGEVRGWGKGGPAPVEIPKERIDELVKAWNLKRPYEDEEQIQDKDADEDQGDDEG